MTDWLWLIPGTPLAGAAAIALLGGYVSAATCARIAALAMLACAATVAALWADGGASGTAHQTLYTWMSVGDWQASVGLRVDRVSLVMVSVAAWVGFLIHLFSVSFMAADYGERRYYVYLNLFVAGMLLFVMADNLLLMYLGWELMGLCSYALIAHWYRDADKARCGRKAFVVTRVGDAALALSIFLLFTHFGTLDFGPLLGAVSKSNVDTGLLAWIAVLILIGAAGKSAQLPLSVWLPDAMAGPSTVSALIHAATMVTAGVYLIARLHPLFEAVPHVLWLVAIVGTVTLVYAGMAALGQHDIKRVIAYSTISQIGYMFLGLGVGAYGLALFHLATHACFKALLFMGAGVVINAYRGDHDIRNMGGLAKRQPYLRLVFLAGSLALAAVPFISAGFYSKDPIIEAAALAPHGALLWSLAILGAVLTGAYAFRLYLMVFAGPERGETVAYRMSWSMALPLGLLAVASLTLGFVELPHGWHLPPGLVELPQGWHLHQLWGPWLAPEVGTPELPHGSTGLQLQLAGMIAPLLGIALAYAIVRRERAGGGTSSVRLLEEGWYLDRLYDLVVVRPYFSLARTLRTLVEGWSLNGAVLGSAVWLAGSGSRLLSMTQNGNAARYASLMVLGAVLMVGYFLWVR
jgi:NADH-quinone oxidoreductase subunit L